MSSTPQVTLVLGTYKNPALLKKTLPGIIGQTYRNFILKIVDDNYPEDTQLIEETKAVVSSFTDSRISYVKNEFNLGVPHVYGKWIDLVDTPFFMILCEGDVLMPEALERLMKCMNSSSTISLVHGKETFEIPNPTSRKVDPFDQDTVSDAKLYLESHLDFGWETRKTYGWSQANALMRKEFWKYHQIPVTNFHFWDFHFHLYYLLYSKKIGFVNYVMNTRHVSESQRANVEQSLPLFSANVERLRQALLFIEANEMKLISMGVNVNSFRAKLSWSLVRQLFNLSSWNERLFCCQLLAKNIRVLVVGHLLLLLLSPLNRSTGKMLRSALGKR